MLTGFGIHKQDRGIPIIDPKIFSGNLQESLSPKSQEFPPMLHAERLWCVFELSAFLKAQQGRAPGLIVRPLDPLTLIRKPFGLRVLGSGTRGLGCRSRDSTGKEDGT